MARRVRKYRTPTYISWECMKQRCLNPNDLSYKYYGGNNITIAEEWLEYSRFYLDMGERPIGTTLDRIDNEKGYSKDNCRWALKEIQENNKSSNTLLTFNGKTQTIAQWGRELNLHKDTIISRLRRGAEVVEALSPKRSNGERYSP